MPVLGVLGVVVLAAVLGNRSLSASAGGIWSRMLLVGGLLVGLDGFWGRRLWISKVGDGDGDVLGSCICVGRYDHCIFCCFSFVVSGIFLRASLYRLWLLLTWSNDGYDMDVRLMHAVWKLLTRWATIGLYDTPGIRRARGDIMSTSGRSVPKMYLLRTM